MVAAVIPEFPEIEYVVETVPVKFSTVSALIVGLTLVGAKVHAYLVGVIVTVPAATLENE